LDILHIAGQMGCRVVLDGYYGDQMFANFGYFVDLARSMRLVQLRREFLEWCRWMVEVDPKIMRHELWWVLWRGLIPYKLVRSVRKYRGVTESRHPAWYVEQFREHALQRYLTSQQKTRRFGSHHAKTCYDFLTARPRLNSVEAENKIATLQGLEKAYPFMDTDLIEFVLAVPGYILNWKGVPKGLLREAMEGVLPESIRYRKWKSDFTGLNNDGVASDYSTFRHYLGSACLAVIKGYMDPIGLKHKFPNQKLDRNNRFPAAQVTSAVALEGWLRVFGGIQ
jgi:asparagine synthase (glutamine-hydrolysing)